MSEVTKRIQVIVGVKADGVWGPRTMEAVAKKLGVQATLEAIQKKVGTKADGVIGPKTLDAICSVFASLNLTTPVKTTDGTCAPRVTQAEVRSGKSVYGKAGDESNMVFVKPPYTIYYDGKPYKHGVKVHKLLAPSLEAIFKELLEAYGAEKIHELHMDNYAGGFFVKKTTGGSSYSIHSWGCAIDWWPEANALKTASPKAGFSKPEYKKWWEIWYKHGWIGLGPERNYDWMHVQAATL